MLRVGNSKSQVVEWLPARKKLCLENSSVFPDNPAGESPFIKDLNSDFYSENKGNGKRNCCNC